MIIPDPFKKTVKIPIRIVDGKAEYFYGGPFPKIRNVTGDLLVPAFSIEEKQFVEECSETDDSEILPEGTSLMMNVWAADSAPGVVRDILSGPQSGNVTVQLLEPLYLWHRGTKSSVLKDCRCLVPALDEEASSLNHAYTIISKKYETKRRSNTGNVFLKAYFEVTANFWAPLQALRDIHDAEFERRHSAKHRGQETEALSLCDSSVIERSVLREVDGHRLVASIDPSGLTIEEDKYREATQHSPQTVRIGSPHRVLLELLKERFTTVDEFDQWIGSKGIYVDFRSARPDENEDDLVASPDHFVASADSLDSRVEARKDSLDLNASIFIDFDHEKRFVEVNETSLTSLDQYFAEGWIHVGSHFARQPLVPTTTVPLLNVPARIRLSDFHFSKHQRRILRKNSDVQIDIEAHSISNEDEELFDRHKVRFGISPPKSIHDIVPKSSSIEIKKITVTEDDRLIAVSYLDVGKTSAYSIYGMFEPSIESRSLGILTMLNEIEFSIAAGKEFYYLGYVFGFPSFYDYKKQFHGLELFDWKGNWIKADKSAKNLKNNDVDPSKEHEQISAHPSGSTGSLNDAIAIATMGCEDGITPNKLDGDSDQELEEKASPSQALPSSNSVALIEATEYVRIGNDQVYSGRLLEAVENYTKAIEIDPEFAIAYYNRGVAYGNQGQPQNAIADYTKAIQIDPRYANAYHNRAGAHREQGNYFLAIADYTKAIELNPDDAEAYSNRGSTHGEHCSFQEAIEDFSEAIRIDPDHAASYYGRGTAFVYQGKYDSAIADFSAAIRIDPNLASAYHHRALAYVQQGTPELALADCNSEIEIEPFESKAFALRASVYERLGEPGLSRADREKAVELGFPPGNGT